MSPAPLLCLLKLLPLLLRLMDSWGLVSMMGGGRVGPPSLRSTAQHWSSVNIVTCLLVSQASQGQRVRALVLTRFSASINKHLGGDDDLARSPQLTTSQHSTARGEAIQCSQFTCV